eukprot:CAMPEP_0194034652 /NCGR_PEP_ID=MMETSP0009_2-20130614/7084_1 /TAXON_ID=210454 /ORGANISM="Grammatophora oceanica, Strain CCMP 410" /LENGTH=301 /DNA_ID=CAMNT_0038675675 /DNA_START=107 /DNA_END=1012 /DNA_ORIENTATION=+
MRKTSQQVRRWMSSASLPVSAMTMVILSVCLVSTSAFRAGGMIVPTTRTSLLVRKSSVEPRSAATTATVFESSIPSPTNNKDNDDDDEKKKKWQFRIKPPENAFVLGGDVLSLMTYAFMDHLVTNHMLSRVLEDPANLEPALLEQFNVPLDPSLTVWLDAASTSTEQWTRIQASLTAEHLHYSPAFATAGLSAVLLTACWIAAGMCFGAFDNKRTLECTMNEMLISLGKAWLGMSALMIGIALYSGMSVCGCPHSPSNVVGLTKCDADFLADSLTVLLAWRTTVNFVLGNNGGSGRRKDKK